MTNNVRIVIENNIITGEEIEFVIIYKGNNEFTSMRKVDYDALEAAKEASGTLS